MQISIENSIDISMPRANTKIHLKFVVTNTYEKEFDNLCVVHYT